MNRIVTGRTFLASSVFIPFSKMMQNLQMEEEEVEEEEEEEETV